MNKHRIAAAMCAVVAVALVLFAPSGTAGERAPSAPVIHEDFTLLPCKGKASHRTTLELEGCGEHTVLRSDAKIDGLNSKIFKDLKPIAARREFISGHNAWLSYRRKYCLSASDADGGGTLAGVLYINCVATVNTAHVKELDALWRSVRSL